MVLSDRDHCRNDKLRLVVGHKDVLHYKARHNDVFCNFG